MGRESALLPSSTRVGDGEAHRDDALFFVHPVTGELWLHYRDNFLISKTDKKFFETLENFTLELQIFLHNVGKINFSNNSEIINTHFCLKKMNVTTISQELNEYCVV